MGCTLQKQKDTLHDETVIGSISFSQDHEEEMLQDVQDSFDVKPKQKQKPSRRSKCLKEKKAKQRQDAAHLNLSFTCDY